MKSRASHLDDKRAEDDAAKDEVVEDAFEDIALAVDLAGVDLVEQLHQHEGVEHDGVVFGGRRVERRVPPAVDIEQFLSCGDEEMKGVGIVEVKVSQRCTLFTPTGMHLQIETWIKSTCANVSRRLDSQLTHHLIRLINYNPIYNLH